ncbi:hypothetical protein GY21_19375 [Cryobacterium roopkundense]|uniref:Uncharacterized protein n=1 Tax=Cryobacterium roopkundense TaxID=1001240 RepID=A0A099J105_9MICO|nr:hypothetical protein [Cryobacterium roopkundense]KGJ71850.1 hypothetical protein GY21_19375 [Cryobacterium roopkundense]MBB5641413.1 hypothetical protein [Cryobacterium roopkundense]
MRRKNLVILTVAVTTVVLMGVGSLAAVHRNDSIVAAQHGYNVALSAYHSAQDEASADLKSSQAAIASARETLQTSAGHVASEEPRTALATALTEAEARLVAEADRLSLAERTAASAPESDSSLFAPGDGLTQAATTLSRLSVKADSPTIAETLVAPEQAVLDSMAAWRSTLYTNHVQAVGWIPELDQCLGSVDITAHYAGVAAIAEHWSCGGKNFPDDAGTVIALTGVHSGIYRVDGIVAMLNSSRNGVGDLPRGHDLLYQTCQNGQGATMSFTALTKIG